MNREEAKQHGLLCRADMIASMQMSESTFDRLNLEPAARSGRNTFYTVRQVLVARLAKELRQAAPWLTENAARQQAEDELR